MTTLWTIGHSTMPITNFRHLLDAHHITHLADVRSRPASRWAPQFNKNALAALLNEHQVAYAHLPALGGLHEGAGEGEAFQEAVTALLARAAESRVAIMCSCGKWQDCHRENMIGTEARARGHRVLHILPSGKVESASDADHASGAIAPDSRPRQMVLFPGESTP